MKTIQLTQGQVALVDDEDYDELSKFKWYAHRHARTVYARRADRINPDKKIAMHQQIMGPPLHGMEIDHINHPGTDNRRTNLRFATKAQNRRNAKLRKDNTSGHKGVSWDKRARKWKVSISVDKKRLTIGRFKDLQIAIAAYSAAAKLHHDRFARLR